MGCNGWRLRRLDDVLQTLAPSEDKLQFVIARDQRMLELAVALPETAIGAPVALSVNDKAPAPALGLRRAWLLAG